MAPVTVWLPVPYTVLAIPLAPCYNGGSMNTYKDGEICEQWVES